MDAFIPAFTEQLTAVADLLSAEILRSRAALPIDYADSMRTGARFWHDVCKSWPYAQKPLRFGRYSVVRTTVMKREYISNFEQFLNLLKQQNPGIDEEQRKGRALLWDKIPLQDAEPTPLDGKLTQPSYVYYNKPD